MRKRSRDLNTDRRELRRRLTFPEAEAMGGGLVMVGSQDARTRALIGEDWDPLQVEAITGTQWCILERVGRARYHGEVTQGRLSLQVILASHWSIFLIPALIG